MPDTEEIRQQRSRLIDHFKRAYQIVVGLAITLACGKVFAHGTIQLNDPALLFFCIFFITVVPIFHGGDRSLDLKYLAAKPTKLRDQAAYVWDVYMLLITAIFFVKIAQAIPGPGLIFLDQPDTAIPGHFYHWMAAMLVFDASVLALDWLKSGFVSSGTWAHGQAYLAWIVLNVALAIVCWQVPKTGLAGECVGLIVLGSAIIRTLLDYLFGREFMFP